MNETLKTRLQKTFAHIFSDFKTETETFNFLQDFLTAKEFEVLAKRLSVGYWLIKKRSYANIQTNLKVSSATIAEVQALLKKPSFKQALKKLEAEEWADEKSLQIRRLLLLKTKK